MTATPQNKLGAYATHQRSNEDARETDARALLSCAGRLKVAIENGDKDMKAYGDAIRHNQRLWTLFQIALCAPDNALPPELKTTLLNLSRYIDRISFRAVTSFMPQLVTEMIDINKAIAAGLSIKPKNAAVPPPDTAQQTRAQIQAKASIHAPAAVITSA